VIALALALALGASPATPAAKGKAPAQSQKAAPSAEQAARLAEEAAALAKEAADMAKEPPQQAEEKPDAIDAEVMGFMSLTQSTAGKDGGVKLPWDGPGGLQLKNAWEALDKRNEQLAMGDMMARSLIEAVRMFYDSEGGLDPSGMRAKLSNLVGSPMEEARTAYLDAVSWEERRLTWVERAVRAAEKEGVAIPGVDSGLVSRRLAAIHDGTVKKQAASQIDGYRDLALGLVAYLDGDNFGALQKVRNAANALPDVAVAHAFLGSLYFLFDQKDAAIRSWRRAYDLDPTNTAVRDALMEHGRKKQEKKKR
jgi:tetratricopeptide (TPR) repeat protein